MKLSENWLRQWVNPNLSTEQIGEQLTMAGLELDDLSLVARAFSGVVVGEVLTCTQHPDADKLKITTVNVGSHSSEPLQIVCGASNVATGARVPVALIGAKLPPIAGTDTPFCIKKGKLRGVQSHGMLCGGAEIDLDDGVDGLLILPDDAPIGVNLREYLNLDNHILDISITPNRGDCFSVRGIARELCVINDLPFKLPFDIPTINASCDDKTAVLVQTASCPRYYARTIINLNGTQKSPKFIQDALLGSGIAPKNLIVDITNFVLMELGQPLHAFDKDKLVGDISVRLAKQGETLVLLNGQSINLTGDELVICDEAGVIALAGIMGGQRTMVDDTTTSIVLESAFFDPLAIAGKARRFGLHTDASQRFERGVDYELPSLALARATSLFVSYGGGKVGYTAHHDNPSNLPVRKPITLPFDSIASLLGVQINKPACIHILQKLAIEVQDNGQTLICTPPSHRFDLSIKEDLVEEIARIYGYDNIANDLPKLSTHFFEDLTQKALHTIKQSLVNAGFFEAISFSFSDEKLENLLDDNQFAKPLALANPISSDLAVMRRTLLSSLLPCMQYNLNRQQNRVRLFETGLVFDGDTIANLTQRPTLALVAVGSQYLENPFDNTAMDFYDLKQVVQSVLPSSLIQNGQVAYQKANLAFLHTGQSADISVNGQKIGYLGQLHPKISKALDLGVVWVAELDLMAVLDLHAQKPSIKTPSKFPQVRRDIAIVVDKSVMVGDLLTLIRQNAGEHLQNASLFDVYEGGNLPDDKRSLAFGLVWQSDSDTLADDTINANVQAVLDSLQDKYGAVLRS